MMVLTAAHGGMFAESPAPPTALFIVTDVNAAGAPAKLTVTGRQIQRALRRRRMRWSENGRRPRCNPDRRNGGRPVRIGHRGAAVGAHRAKVHRGHGGRRARVSVRPDRLVADPAAPSVDGMIPLMRFNSTHHVAEANPGPAPEIRQIERRGAVSGAPGRADGLEEPRVSRS